MRAQPLGLHRLVGGKDSLDVDVFFLVEVEESIGRGLDNRHRGDAAGVDIDDTSLRAVGECHPVAVEILAEVADELHAPGRVEFACEDVIVEDSENVKGRFALRVALVSGHRVIDVEDGEDTAESRNLILRGAIGIARAITALVMLEHAERDVALVTERTVLDELIAILRVFTHLSELLVGELALLVENLRRDARLAAVDEQARKDEVVQLVFGHIFTVAHDAREDSNVQAMVHEIVAFARHVMDLGDRLDTVAEVFFAQRFHRLLHSVRIERRPRTQLLKHINDLAVDEAVIVNIARIEQMVASRHVDGLTAPLVDIDGENRPIEQAKNHFVSEFHPRVDE